MAMALPSLYEIAGSHLRVYEEFFSEATSGQHGLLKAEEAAAFLRRSNLDNATLGQVWNVADVSRRGLLDKQGFFIALKLIALVQQGQQPVQENLAVDVDPPMFFGSGFTPVPFADSETEWCIQPDDRKKYEDIFYSLMPVNGKLSGEQVKPVLFNSGLSKNLLRKIWDLSDIDKDGHLDKHEMTLALHLVYRALENDPVPDVLPLSMIPPAKREQYKPSSTAAISRSTPVPVMLPCSRTAWPVDVGAWQLEFRNLDTNDDGLISGAEAKPEKRELEAEIVQAEADMKVKQAEIRNLEVEYNTLEATINQMERQKLEAQKRLDELDVQKETLEDMVSKLKVKLEQEEADMLTLDTDVERNSEFIRMQNTVDQLKTQHVTLNEQLAHCNGDVKLTDLNRLTDKLTLPPIESITLMDDSKVQHSNQTNEDEQKLTFIDNPFLRTTVSRAGDPFAQIEVQSQIPFTCEDPFATVDPFADASSFDVSNKDVFTSATAGGFVSDSFNTSPSTNAPFDPFKPLDGTKETFNTQAIYYLPFVILFNQCVIPSLLSTLPAARYILQHEKIEILHSHSSLSTLAQEFMFHANLIGVRTVFTDHSLFGFADMASVAGNKMLECSLVHCNRVICVSHTGAAIVFVFSKENLVLRSSFPSERVYVIPNALDTHHFTPDPSQRCPSKINIVIACRLTYRKGIDLLARVIPRICSEHADVDFIIAGDGPMRILLEEILVLGNIFLNTSLTEAFCMTILEAANIVLVLGKVINRCRAGLQLEPWKVHRRIVGMYSWTNVAKRTERVYMDAVQDERHSYANIFANVLSARHKNIKSHEQSGERQWVFNNNNNNNSTLRQS
ncbi:N-acetylglucosaminyl-phosphatidylinositol biosynthetic protein [Trichinella nativa]|uniref:N-acetylglucosaminyl-phosphatidylinositol biosynthetic protein n=1 Tax=Trichinella nativa TaxID=6335 RepID=A0A0V1L9V7_9BILA|nr:N-acetylglucosaminyl-phosphatidylinositol biosynthetic protein [Trichinella nativa]